MCWVELYQKSYIQLQHIEVTDPKMSEQQKYRVVYDLFKQGETYENQLNALVDVGYKIRSVRDNFIVMEYDPKGEITAQKKVKHDEVESLYKIGWRVEATYSGHTIMVRRE